MKVWQTILLILLGMIIVFEFVPAVQQKIHWSLRKWHRRLCDLRAFVDDEEYNVTQAMSNCPFTMSEYLQKREHETWEKIRQRAHTRRKEGWGSIDIDGPDQHEPLSFWWHQGTLIPRRQMLS
jgi:hypothetical protein